MPSIYRCPSHRPKTKKEEVETFYVAVVGEKTLWSPTVGGVKLSEVKDGFSNTIAFVESQDTPVHWASPVDIDYDLLVKKNRANQIHIFSSPHEGPTNVVMGDASFSQLPEETKFGQIQAALTKAGGEAEEIDW